MAKSAFVGVDGCRFGWFSVGFDRCGNYELEVFPAFSELLHHYGDAKLVLVDIPIGLPEGPGGRDCDGKARKLLGPRRSSVFPTPTRRTVRQAARSPGDYRTAGEIEHCVARKGLSGPAFAIAPKIAEVDRVMLARDASAPPRIKEVHPELCFWALNNKKPIQYGKKTKEGRDKRRRVLERIESQTQQILDEAYHRFLGGGVAKDDILDALAAAVTAYCGHDRLQTIPEAPPKDAKCLPMEMVVWVRWENDG